MFKLIKLAFYAVIGYALYELFMGFKEGGMGMGEGGRQNISGEGEGMRERSEEPSGMSASHQVGRGVVS